jgi:hypothetical protein
VNEALHVSHQAKHTTFHQRSLPLITSKRRCHTRPQKVFQGPFSCVREGVSFQRIIPLTCHVSFATRRPTPLLPFDAGQPVRAPPQPAVKPRSAAETCYCRSLSSAAAAAVGKKEHGSAHIIKSSSTLCPGNFDAHAIYPLY